MDSSSSLDSNGSLDAVLVSSVRQAARRGWPGHTGGARSSPGRSSIAGGGFSGLFAMSEDEHAAATQAKSPCDGSRPAASAMRRGEDTKGESVEGTGFDIVSEISKNSSESESNFLRSTVGSRPTGTQMVRSEIDERLGEKIGLRKPLCNDHPVLGESIQSEESAKHVKRTYGAGTSQGETDSGSDESFSSDDLEMDNFHAFLDNLASELNKIQHSDSEHEALDSKICANKSVQSSCRPCCEETATTVGLPDAMDHTGVSEVTSGAEVSEKKETVPDQTYQKTDLTSDVTSVYEEGPGIPSLVESCALEERCSATSESKGCGNGEEQKIQSFSVVSPCTFSTGKCIQTDCEVKAHVDSEAGSPEVGKVNMNAQTEISASSLSSESVRTDATRSSRMQEVIGPAASHADTAVVDAYCEKTFWLLDNFGSSISEGWGCKKSKVRSALARAKACRDRLNARHGLTVTDQLIICNEAIASTLKAWKRLFKYSSKIKPNTGVDEKHVPTTGNVEDMSNERLFKHSDELVPEVYSDKNHVPTPSGNVQRTSPLSKRSTKPEPTTDESMANLDEKGAPTPSETGREASSEEEGELRDAGREASSEKEGELRDAGREISSEEEGELRDATAWDEIPISEFSRTFFEDAFGAEFLRSLPSRPLVDALFATGHKRLVANFHYVANKKHHLSDPVQNYLADTEHWAGVPCRDLQKELLTGFGELLGNIRQQRECLPLNPFQYNYASTGEVGYDGREERVESVSTPRKIDNCKRDSSVTDVICTSLQSKKKQRKKTKKKKIQALSLDNVDESESALPNCDSQKPSDLNIPSLMDEFDFEKRVVGPSNWDLLSMGPLTWGSPNWGPHSWSPQWIGPPNCGPPNCGPPNGGPPNNGQSNCGPPSWGPYNSGPTNWGPRNWGPLNWDPPNCGPPNLGLPNWGPQWMGPPNCVPPNCVPPNCGPPNCGPPKSGPPNVGPTSFCQSNCGPPNGGPPMWGPPNWGPPNWSPSNLGPSNGGPPNNGQPNCGTPNGGPPNGGPPTFGPPNVGPPNGGPPNYGQSNCGPPICGLSSWGPPNCGPPSGGPSHEPKPAGLSSGERPSVITTDKPGQGAPLRCPDCGTLGLHKCKNRWLTELVLGEGADQDAS